MANIEWRECRICFVKYPRPALSKEMICWNCEGGFKDETCIVR